MKFYHGSDQELVFLQKNSYVTKIFKDACKFGYRRSILSKSPFVYIYELEIEMSANTIIKDNNRDRAFITLISIEVKLIDKYLTYQTPYKLEKFKIRR